MLRSFIARISSFGDLAKVALRVVLGLVLAYHGYGKVTHGFAVSVFADKFHIILPQITGPFISLLELIGGLCLIVGLFTRYLGVLFTIEFIVVMLVLWVGQGAGWGATERELLILFSSLYLATNGGGQLSLDKSIGRWEA
jgi:putative oxidoreductase